MRSPVHPSVDDPTRTDLPAAPALDPVAALEAWFVARPATGRMRELVGDAGVLERRAQSVLDALAAVRAVAPPAAESHPHVDPAQAALRALAVGTDALERELAAVRADLVETATALADAVSAVRALDAGLPVVAPAPVLPDPIGEALVALAAAQSGSAPPRDPVGERLVELAAALADDDEAPATSARRRHAYRAAHAVLAVVFVAGAATVADGVVTLVWQEPVTAVYATWQQRTLDDELGDLRRSYDKATTALVREAPRDRVRDVATLAARLDARTKTGHALGRLVVPKLGLSMVFGQGTGTNTLKKGPGHYDGTALPGGRGTVGIAGHRTTFLAPFRHIDRLRRGDVIEARMPYGTFTYRVVRRQVVRPSQVSVLTSTAGADRIVLTACHPLASASHRMVVTARLAIMDLTKRG